ncbi:hypothetical protein JANAI62_09750 [Jannaschia pagri]|uniref:DUF3179 domain-containing protein n=2 Tax=Roseobacteraceae TaxID=2854170 RepID=A0ABQ4NIX7_9RHOB|nr:hypothetical protein JANAI62_09750 [Jannaschia sp. AI_62]
MIATFLTALASGASAQKSTPPLADWVLAEYGPAPVIPQGELSAELRDAVTGLVAHSIAQADWSTDDRAVFDVIAEADDPRVAWLLTDMMRFSWRTEFRAELAGTAIDLLGVEVTTFNQFIEIVDHLLAWDIPAYPDYLGDKRAVFNNYVPGWERIFVEGEIDWHQVTWGGVNIDTRPFGRTDEVCDCIPAADNPEVETAEEATWLGESDIIFGIVINGEARAYPRRIMEVREMVNDTLGGRDLGIPYCTLCGAMQAYFTDNLPAGVERPILRTSGLLIRSNKVMYDLETWSVFDTFLGKAVTGPLAEIGLELEQATVVTTEWGAWRAAHPETTVLIEDLALGRDFDFRNGRDARGPIFPVGDVDPRLPVHEDVIGVTAPSGQKYAFQRSAAVAALIAGQEVTVDDIRLRLDGTGVRAEGTDGSDLGSHEAFWFAWSQFHPNTALWPQ